MIGLVTVNKAWCAAMAMRVLGRTDGSTFRITASLYQILEIILLIARIVRCCSISSLIE